MQGSITVILESILFSPVSFLLVILVCWIYSFKLEKEKFQKDHRASFLLKIFSSLWIFLFITSNILFYHALSYPLKLLTPQSIKHKADAVVVASAGVEDSGAPRNASTVRAHAAAELYLEEWAPIVIVTGGVTYPYRPPLKIKGIPIILQGMGVNDEDIIIENRSIDTYGNGLETLKILKSRGIERILLVSHDYHLFRVSSVFEKLGVTVYPYSANQMDINTSIQWWNYFDWGNFNRLKTIFHEYIGLFNYKITGKI